MHSHHSHSGQFCGHAVDTLEEVVREAIRMGFRQLAMTEHMPRDRREDLYPEEEEGDGRIDPDGLQARFEAFYGEARRLRAKYGAQLALLVGFETEYIRPDSLRLVDALTAAHDFDLAVGSVHHVRGIMIDHDRARWEAARAACGGSTAGLVAEYAESQHRLVAHLRPAVIGHFDLFRLFAPDPTVAVRTMSRAWDRMMDTVRLVVAYGGLFEINTAALRKGLPYPYPFPEIATSILELGGRFCLSDDSHGRAQLATNYHQLQAYFELINLDTLYYWSGDPSGPQSVPVSELYRFTAELECNSSSAAVDTL